MPMIIAKSLVLLLTSWMLFLDQVTSTLTCNIWPLAESSVSATRTETA